MTFPSFENVVQVTVDGVVRGSTYALLGVALGLIVGVTRRFHVAFAVSYTLAAFAAAWLGRAFALPFWAALGAGAVAAAAAGMAMEAFVYRPMSRTTARVGGNLFLMTFVASLGLSIVGRNAIALSSLGSSSVSISGFQNARVALGSVSTTSLDIASTATSWLLILTLGLILSRTTFGRTIRAVRSNPRMSLCTGIDPAAVFLAVFAIGSALGGVSAVFQATKTSATPEMGIVPLFYALVVAFLAGLSSSPLACGATGLAIGLAQSYSALFLPTQWTPLVVFGILFAVVALRPIDVGTLRARARVDPA